MNRVIFTALFLVPLSILNRPAFSDTISMRADVWCPYNCDPSSKDLGLAIEIAEYAFAKKGHKIDYQIFPWPRTVITGVSSK